MRHWGMESGARTKRTAHVGCGVRLIVWSMDFGLIHQVIDGERATERTRQSVRCGVGGPCIASGFPPTRRQDACMVYCLFIFYFLREF